MLNRRNTNNHQHRHRCSHWKPLNLIFLKSITLNDFNCLKERKQMKKSTPWNRIEIRIFLNLLSNEWKRKFHVMNKKKDSFIFFLLWLWSWTKRYEYITSNCLNKINSGITMNAHCSCLMSHAPCPWCMNYIVCSFLLEWNFYWTAGKQIIGSMHELFIFHSCNCWTEIDRHL